MTSSKPSSPRPANPDSGSGALVRIARRFATHLLRLLPLGLIVGVMVGVLFGDPWFGLAAGAALGAGLGVFFALLTGLHEKDPPRR